MNIGRRILLAVVVLVGLALPAPAAQANPFSGGWGIEWGYRVGDGGVVIAGLATNHTNTRQENVVITATWHNGATVVASEMALALVSNVAPHSATPFRMVELTDVTGAQLTVTAIGTAAVADSWDEPLSVEPGTLVVDTYTGMVRNDGESLTAEDVVVYGVRRQGGIIVDARGSAPIASLAPGAAAAYTLVFDSFAGETVGGLIAEAIGDTYRHTSWNNWFSDLGNSSFAEEIHWLADADITDGCSTHQFCPTSPVTRWQMAVFLDRALDLPTAPEPAPFTDLADRPAYVRQAVANVYDAGIASGCTATTFCPLAPVTRGQMSKFIVLGYGLAPLPGALPFSDDNGHFSEPYNNRMSLDGITSGCAPGKFCPHASVLREQMAKFLYRAEH